MESNTAGEALDDLLGSRNVLAPAISVARPEDSGDSDDAMEDEGPSAQAAQPPTTMDSAIATPEPEPHDQGDDERGHGNDDETVAKTPDPESQGRSLRPRNKAPTPPVNTRKRGGATSKNPVGRPRKVKHDQPSSFSSVGSKATAKTAMPASRDKKATAKSSTRQSARIQEKAAIIEGVENRKMTPSQGKSDAEGTNVKKSTKEKKTTKKVKLPTRDAAESPVKTATLVGRRDAKALEKAKGVVLVEK